MVIRKLVVCTLILSFLLTGCNNEKKSDTEKEPSKQEETVVDDGYLVYLPSISEMRANESNKNPTAPKEFVVNVGGKSIVANRKERSKHHMGTYVYYERYWYDCEDENISLSCTTKGDMVSFSWNETEDRSYKQIAQDYFGSVTTLTQDECVQKCFDFLEAQSVDTRGFKAEEVVFDEEKRSYTVNLQGYIEDIPTYEEAEVSVTEFGLVYHYSGVVVGTVPYYEENPFDMKKVRYEVMQAAHRVLIPGEEFDREYDELEIKILDYKFYCVPDEGVALYFSVTAYLYDNSGGEPERVSGSWIMTLVVHF